MSSIFYRVAYPITFYFGTLIPEILPRNKHWNEISKGLILGAQPISTKILNRGDHANKLIKECKKNKLPLAAVYSVLNKFELDGKGLGVLNPVSPTQWKNHGVKHNHISMDDFGGNVDIKAIKKQVDDMHKHIKNKKTVYVHCKAGKGRSFTFILCYLLSHTKLNVNEAIELIRKERPNVSPSMAQFKTIELYRATYCKDKAPLNKNSKSFQSYRKDWFRHISNNMVHGLIAHMISVAILPARFIGVGVGVSTMFASKAIQKYKANYDEKAFKQLKRKDSFSKLSKPALQAVQTGINSGTTWKGWSKNLFDLNAGKHYQLYRAGLHLAQENDPLCAQVKKRLSSQK